MPTSAPTLGTSLWGTRQGTRFERGLEKARLLSDAIDCSFWEETDIPDTFSRARWGRVTMGSGIQGSSWKVRYLLSSRSGRGEPRGRGPWAGSLQDGRYWNTKEALDDLTGVSQPAKRAHRESPI